MSTIRDLSFRTMQDELSGLVHNPNLAVSYVINELTKLTDEGDTIVDPSNAFMYLLEASLTSSAATLQHLSASWRSTYPVMSSNLSELYHHLSDQDYANLFGLPASTTFSWVLQYDSLINSAITNDEYAVVTIPKDTLVMGGNYPFTVDAEIEIRLYNNKNIRVLENTNGGGTKVIPSSIYKEVEGGSIVTFDTLLWQVRKAKHLFDLTRSIGFTKEIAFVDQYQTCDVLYKVNGVWTPLAITHSARVYDPYTPTAVLTVKEQSLTVYIPKTYTTSGDIGSEVLVIVHTTLGSINEDFSVYSGDMFSSVLADHINGLSDANVAFGKSSYMVFTSNYVSGGRHALSFTEVRQRVLDNNVGMAITPITHNNLLVDLQDHGFDSTRYQDTLTGRTYLVSDELPKGTGVPFYTEVSTGFLRLEQSYLDLKDITTVNDHGDRITILPETIYRIEDTNVSIEPSMVIDAILEKNPNDIEQALNNVTYRYSPYYYIVDYSGGAVSTRVYQLNRPTVDTIDYSNRNNSIDLFISTDHIDIYLTATGYRIVVTLTEDAALSELTTADVFSQLVYESTLDNDTGYLNPTSTIKTDGVFSFIFDLRTSLEVDEDDNMILTGLTNKSGVLADKHMGISSSIRLYHGLRASGATYRTTYMDDVVFKVSVNDPLYPIAEENITLTLGSNLTYLWRNTRVIDAITEYQTYEYDVPLTYTSTGYHYDGSTDLPFHVNDNCEIVFDEPHQVGDTVRDAGGNQILKHRAGDLILDASGAPIPIDIKDQQIAIDILCLDGVFKFVTDETVLSYLEQVEDYILSRSTEGVAGVRGRTLEHTDLYYKPIDRLGYTRIAPIEGESTSITKQQYLEVIFYVLEDTYNSIDARNKITSTTIETINYTFTDSTVSYSTIMEHLRIAHGDLVVSMSINGLGGLSQNHGTLQILIPGDRLSIPKKLSVTQDNLLSISDNIDITFIKYG